MPNRLIKSSSYFLLLRMLPIISIILLAGLLLSSHPVDSKKSNKITVDMDAVGNVKPTKIVEQVDDDDDDEDEETTTTAGDDDDEDDVDTDLDDDLEDDEDDDDEELSVSEVRAQVMASSSGIYTREDSEKTTHLWQLISQNDMYSLRSIIMRDPPVVHLRSKDGRGPLFWAYEYGKMDIVNMLIEFGADQEQTDEKGNKPRDMEKVKAAPIEIPQQQNSNQIDFQKFKNCRDCLKSGFGWCPIRKICGGFANQECTKTETDYSHGFEPISKKY